MTVGSRAIAAEDAGEQEASLKEVNKQFGQQHLVAHIPVQQLHPRERSLEPEHAVPAGAADQPHP
jgi:hypothetical protein